MINVGIQKYIKEMRIKGLSYKEAVEELIGRELGSRASIPIDIVRLAQNLGFKIYSGEFKGYSLRGCMEIGGNNRLGKRYICVGNKEYSAVKSFIIAHEIGHYILHYSGKGYFGEKFKYDGNFKGRLKSSRERVEEEADIFAMELLVPSKLLEDYIDNEYNGNKCDLIIGVANKFNVSISVAERRVGDVGYIDRMLGV